jgi:tetratricopeptide (TPR) repeat protein
VSIPTVQNFLQLVSSPTELKHFIEAHRERLDLDKSVLGFIALYDSLDGDCGALQRVLNENKSHVLKPLLATKQRAFIPNFLRYAAIFCIIIASSVFVYSYFSGNRMELSSRFNDPGIPNFMSAEENNEMTTIMFYYQKKEYEKADLHIQSALKHQPTNDTLRYYASVVKFLEESGDSGLKGFERLGKGNSKYKAKSIYYQGLIYVHQGNYELAISRFKEAFLLEDEAVSSYAKAHIKQLELYLKSK